MIHADEYDDDDDDDKMGIRTRMVDIQEHRLPCILSSAIMHCSRYEYGEYHEYHEYVDENGDV